jgi:hypothetical protein
MIAESQLHQIVTDLKERAENSKRCGDKEMERLYRRAANAVEDVDNEIADRVWDLQHPKTQIK